MWWLPRIIAGYVDLVCATVNESIKSVLHEIWCLIAQVVNGLSVVSLGFLYPKGYKSHLEHRNRIKKNNVPNMDRRRSIFAQIVEESTDDITGEKLEKDKEPETEKDIAAEKLRQSPRAKSRINSSRKNNRRAYTTAPSLQRLNDLAHYHEHMTTGLLEDIFTNIMLLIDRIFLRVRLIIRSFVEVVTLSRFPPIRWFLSLFNPFKTTTRLTNAYQKVKNAPEKLVSSDQLDMRQVKDIIEHAGYPYEQHKVVTDDGYILLLERIPNPNSKHVLYLQHGVFDSAFAWVATGAAALAYRSHDLGYDVFLGNFRGNGDREHVRKNITGAEYWNFSINEHAFKDYPAFINAIINLKRAEFATPTSSPVLSHPAPSSPGGASSPSHGASLSSKLRGRKIDFVALKKKEHINNNRSDSARGRVEGSVAEPDPQFRLSVISHSMGAAATLMYIVQCRLQGIPHHLSQAILLSPAGYHKKIPVLCKILGPLIELGLRCVPIYVFRFPSNSARVWTAKAFHGLMNSGALGTLAAYMLSKFLFGGDIQDSPIHKVHNLAYNTFTGTAVPILRHFLQLYDSGKFQAFDYGTARNREIYGHSKPIDFLSNFDKIDIPIHYCVGLDDNLISPSNVIHQYNVLRAVHPELAFLKASKNGHLEFTLGLDEPLLAYMLNALVNDKKVA